MSTPFLKKSKIIFRNDFVLVKLLERNAAGGYVEKRDPKSAEASIARPFCRTESYSVSDDRMLVPTVSRTH